MNARLLQYLHALDETLARQEVEKQAAGVDWDKGAERFARRSGGLMTTITRLSRRSRGREPGPANLP